MRTRKLGSLDVSIVGLGCNNLGNFLDEVESIRVVHAAVDHGVTLFDTADTYGNRGKSEEYLGKALKGKRERVVVATKFGLPMDDRDDVRRGSRQYVRQAVHASLRRLETDWIDLYQYHRLDPKTPIEETLDALDELVKAGKVREIGCSTLPAWKLVENQWASRQKDVARFVCCQEEYSALRREVEAELIPAMTAYDVRLLPYYPLAGGLLTGKYSGRSIPEGTRFARSERFASRHVTEENWRRLDALDSIADRHGCTLLQLAFAWLVSKEIVASVIAGATKPEQIKSNVEAGHYRLSAEALAEIDALD